MKRDDDGKVNYFVTWSETRSVVVLATSINQAVKIVHEDHEEDIMRLCIKATVITNLY